MPRTDIITPIIHRNGDSQETLMEQLNTAYSAVKKALEAMHECTPNGRNFYPEPGRLQRYQAQHLERLVHLNAVRDSLLAEARQLEREAHSLP